MNYKVLADGSLLFRTPLSLTPENYWQDPQNPLRYHPAFECACKYRSRHTMTKPCGALDVSWFCTLKKVNVSVPFCNDCDVENKI